MGTRLIWRRTCPIIIGTPSHTVAKSIGCNMHEQPSGNRRRSCICGTITRGCVLLDKEDEQEEELTQAGADLEDVGELGVAEGDMGGAGGEGVDGVPQGTQALVDELGFPEALPLGLRPAHPLTARQIHKPQLGPPHIPCP